MGQTCDVYYNDVKFGRVEYNPSLKRQIVEVTDEEAYASISADLGYDLLNHYPYTLVKTIESVEEPTEENLFTCKYILKLDTRYEPPRPTYLGSPGIL